jgi:hypothetical protein
MALALVLTVGLTSKTIHIAVAASASAAAAAEGDSSASRYIATANQHKEDFLDPSEQDDWRGTEDSLYSDIYPANGERASRHSTGDSLYSDIFPANRDRASRHSTKDSWYNDGPYLAGLGRAGRSVTESGPPLYSDCRFWVGASEQALKLRRKKLAKKHRVFYFWDSNKQVRFCPAVWILALLLVTTNSMGLRRTIDISQYTGRLPFGFFLPYTDRVPFELLDSAALL